ncbi:MAG: hypothetical protein WCI62_04165 [Erysipelotrichaceae bacterium]
MKTLFNQNTYKVILFGLFIGLCLLIFGRPYALGFLLGVMVSYVSMGLLEAFINRIFFNKTYSGFSGYIFFTFRNIFLGVPLLLGVIYPNVINIYTAALGVMYFKIVLYTKEIFFRKNSQV